MTVEKLHTLYSEHKLTITEYNPLLPLPLTSPPVPPITPPITIPLLSLLPHLLLLPSLPRHAPTPHPTTSPTTVSKSTKSLFSLISCWTLVPTSSGRMSIRVLQASFRIR